MVCPSFFQQTNELYYLEERNDDRRRVKDKRGGSEIRQNGQVIELSPDWFALMMPCESIAQSIRILSSVRLSMPKLSRRMLRHTLWMEARDPRVSPWQTTELMWWEPCNRSCWMMRSALYWHCIWPVSVAHNSRDCSPSPRNWPRHRSTGLCCVGDQLVPDRDISSFVFYALRY